MHGKPVEPLLHGVMAEFATPAASIDEVFSASDFVTLHIPGGPANKGSVGKKQFGLMKKTAFFINAARGDVVVEADLIQALRDGAIAGAAISLTSLQELVTFRGRSDWDQFHVDAMFGVQSLGLGYKHWQGIDDRDDGQFQGDRRPAAADALFIQPVEARHLARGRVQFAQIRLLASD